MKFFADHFRIIKINVQDTLHSKSTKYGRPFSVIKSFWKEHEKILITHVKVILVGLSVKVLLKR
jgi:hypothetical protein